MFGSYVGMLLLAGECAGSIVPETPCQLVGGTFTVDYFFANEEVAGSDRSRTICHDGDVSGIPLTPAELCDPSTVDYPKCWYTTVNQIIECIPENANFIGVEFGSTITTYDDVQGTTSYTLNCALYEPPPAPPAPPAPGPDSGGLSGGEIAGIVVGSVFGGVLILVVAMKSGFFRGGRNKEVILSGGLIDGF